MPNVHAMTISDRATARIRERLRGKPLGRFATALLFTGPAVIASIAYMDPGNFATNVQAGAAYGYSLLWVVLFANVVAMLFQALSAKLGIVTGRHLAEHCRDQFPPRVVFAMWLLSEVAAMATDLAEFVVGAIGFALGLALGLSRALDRIAELPVEALRPGDLVVGTIERLGYLVNEVGPRS